MPEDADSLNRRGQQAWNDALLAARIARIGGPAIGGIWLKARAGGVRDRFLEIVRAELPPSMPWIRLPVGATAAVLHGSVDLAASAQLGRPVAMRGLLAAADGGVLVIPMAERLDPAAAALIAMALDQGCHADPLGRQQAAVSTRFQILAIDEAAEDEQAAPRALTDRLALRVDLDAVAWRQTAAPGSEAASTGLPPARLGEDALQLLALLAQAAGNPSLHLLRHLALVARLHAAAFGRGMVGAADIEASLRLCLGVQVNAAPEQPQDGDAESAPAPDAMPPTQAGQPGPPDGESPEQDDDRPQPATPTEDPALQEWLSAVEAGCVDALPAITAQRIAARSGIQAGKAGAIQRNTRRGRPFAIAQSPPFPDARPDLAATLRSAAPWQRIRAIRRQESVADQGLTPRLLVGSQDFRYLRRRHATPSTAIFLVDASGSTALERLGETKGAIEKLLARCYVRRDEVALIAFRGTVARLILPPTRSLTLAKRTLAGLPGGGPTPLVSGLDLGLDLALTVRRQGGSPVLVLLTDGSGNIARDGSPDRARARDELQRIAALYRGLNLHTICIDIARRPREQVASLAADLGADLHVLRQAEAGRLSDLVYSSMRGAEPC